MIKSRYIYNFSEEDWQQGKVFILQEVLSLGHTHPITILLLKAITDFESGKFSYDGATFVKERTKCKFDATSFIHDWRNAMGFISYKVDREMLDIMILLGYNLSLINWRWFLTRFTFLNIIRHKILCSYVGSLPDDLYKLPTLKHYSENHPNQLPK